MPDDPMPCSGCDAQLHTLNEWRDHRKLHLLEYWVLRHVELMRLMEGSMQDMAQWKGDPNGR